jgi:hypothetical protein
LLKITSSKACAPSKCRCEVSTSFYDILRKNSIHIPNKISV